MTREEKNKRQREYRIRNGNACTKKYEKTKKGFLMRLYRNMQSRILGIQKLKFHLYEGKSLAVTREEFYYWALSNEMFHTLFRQYELSVFDQRLAPSVDRIDSSKGYEFSNMEFVTNSINSSRGSISRYNKGTHANITA